MKLMENAVGVNLTFGVVFMLIQKEGSTSYSPSCENGAREPGQVRYFKIDVTSVVYDMSV